jgi:hypothetical protein
MNIAMGALFSSDAVSSIDGSSRIFTGLFESLNPDAIVTAFPDKCRGHDELRHRLLLATRAVRRTMSRLRDDFPPPLFGDSNLAIMLACFSALIEGQCACVKQIKSILDESDTAALRRIDALEAAGLIGRQRDPRDGRRTFLLLTGRGASAMANFFAAIETAGIVTAQAATGPFGLPH